MRKNKGVYISGAIDKITCTRQLNLRNITQMLYTDAFVAFIRIDACTDSSCSHIYGFQIGKGHFDPSDVTHNCRRKGMKLLSHAYRYRILQMCTPQLDDIIKFNTFVQQCLLQQHELLQQVFNQK